MVDYIFMLYHMLYNIQVIYNYYNMLIYTNLPQKPLRCASIICEVLKTTKLRCAY